MSTSLLCRAALTAAAPSARGGGDVRRLPGRCRAPGAGFRGVGFITLSTTMAPPPKPKVNMLVCACKIRKASDPWPWDNDDFKGNQEEIDKFYAELSKELEYLRSYGDDDDDDEFDKYYASLCKQTEEFMFGQFIEILPLEISEEERAVQNKVQEIAQRCMDLQADAMRRLRPEQRRPLYLLFRTVHFAFTSVKVRAMEGNANFGVSSLLMVEKLDVVRKMVSSACSAPLPLDDRDKHQLGSSLPPHVEEAIGSNSLPDEEVTFALVEYTYNTVKSDIDKMITASATSTS